MPMLDFYLDNPRTPIGLNSHFRLFPRLGIARRAMRVVIRGFTGARCLWGMDFDSNTSGKKEFPLQCN